MTCNFKYFLNTLNKIIKNIKYLFNNVFLNKKYKLIKIICKLLSDIF